MDTKINTVCQQPAFSETMELDTAITAAVNWLADNQYDDGYWVGELESNACMEAEWLMAFHILGIPSNPLVPGLIEGILKRQRPDGAWETYYEAPLGDVNATVECYAALRSTGLSAEHPALVRARQWIFDNHAMRHIRVFTRYWLAMLGEWPWHKTPALPAEMIFLPRWAPFNIYHFASWARATMVPLMILSHRQPVTPLKPECRLHELFPAGRNNFDFDLPKKKGGWARFFSAADTALKSYRNVLRQPPMREKAIAYCCEWIVRHQDADGSWGGIQPPWIYSLIALHGEDYGLEHPVLHRGLAALDSSWSFERDGAHFVQACESPVWDTALSLLGMADAGVLPSRNQAMHRGIEWLLSKQNKQKGDWALYLHDVEPGGWAFEHANRHYPDVDDTAIALQVLAKCQDDLEASLEIREALKLGQDWMLAMQCRSGGWGAFDKDNDKDILTKIPFSDFGETIDPASVDVTGHVLEALAQLGFDHSHPVISRALDFIWHEQEADGSWFGRWGVNHIYGTGAVLPALEAVGVDMTSERVRRAVRWIVDHQNEDGGWGETCASYMDESLRGQGESTASQTAWALIALVSSPEQLQRESVKLGLDFLCQTQLDNGSWDETHYTGTGFPGYGIGKRIDLNDDVVDDLRQDVNLSRGFMIKYNMYRHYFPLMAIGRARRWLSCFADEEMAA